MHNGAWAQRATALLGGRTAAARELRALRRAATNPGTIAQQVASYSSSSCADAASGSCSMDGSRGLAAPLGPFPRLFAILRLDAPPGGPGSRSSKQQERSRGRARQEWTLLRRPDSCLPAAQRPPTRPLALSCAVTAVMCVRPSVLREQQAGQGLGAAERREAGQGGGGGGAPWRPSTSQNCFVLQLACCACVIRWQYSGRLQKIFTIGSRLQEAGLPAVCVVFGSAAGNCIAASTQPGVEQPRPRSFSCRRRRWRRQRRHPPCRSCCCNHTPGHLTSMPLTRQM